MRLDNPMWGKRKIAALLRREGFASVSTVGRILKRVMERCRLVPVPILRRRPEKRASVCPSASATPRVWPRAKGPIALRIGPDRHAVRQPCARQGDQARHRL
jgi:hypothetical protein